MEIDYKIIYSKQRKRSILIKIEDDGTPVVYAPHRTRESDIKKFIDSKRSWILKKSMSVKKRNENKFCFVSERKILYFGREHELVINESALLTKGGFCEFVDKKLIVSVPKKVAGQLGGEISDAKLYILKLIRDWYVSEANKKLEEKTLEYARLHNFPVKNICAKEQKTMWGCCDVRNNIRFNWRIIMADEVLMDYLVVHELSHTIEKNHSKAFWEIVESIIPNHKELRKKLKGMNYLLKMEF